MCIVRSRGIDPTESEGLVVTVTVEDMDGTTASPIKSSIYRCCNKHLLCICAYLWNVIPSSTSHGVLFVMTSLGSMLARCSLCLLFFV